MLGFPLLFFNLQDLYTLTWLLKCYCYLKFQYQSHETLLKRYQTATFLVDMQCLFASLPMMKTRVSKKSPTGPTERTPKPWVSNSPSNLLRGPLVRSHSIFDGVYHRIILKVFGRQTSARRSATMRRAGSSPRQITLRLSIFLSFLKANEWNTIWLASSRNCHAVAAILLRDCWSSQFAF